MENVRNLNGNLIIKKVVKIQLNAEEPQFEGEQQIHIQF